MLYVLGYTMLTCVFLWPVNLIMVSLRAPAQEKKPFQHCDVSLKKGAGNTLSSNGVDNKRKNDQLHVSFKAKFNFYIIHISSTCISLFKFHNQNDKRF